MAAGDKRAATTAVIDGNRPVGTTIDPAVAERILGKGEKYTGAARIQTVSYIIEGA